MTDLPIPEPTCLGRLITAVKSLIFWPGPDLDPKTADAETCAERAFLMATVDLNPEAFSSDLDVQHLARLCRCKS